ncbi:MAG: cobalamin-binding protein [Magnetovibrio sp.]|nr:cobalamin-binding protein [Magnetovibrio sp.]
MVPTNIVTLLASATEIVCALGYEDELIARSHECDYPVSVTTLPACTESKINKNNVSIDIDAQVKTIVEQGLSVYRVDGDLLRRLQPNFIITQTQCEVCSASPKDLANAVQDWTGGKPNIVSLEPNRLSDVWTDIQNVANALGVPERGEELIVELQGRMDKIQARISQVKKRPRVACIEWIDPLMAAGNWMPELVEKAGGKNIFGEAGIHSPWVAWKAFCDADPDLVLIMPCGFNMRESRRDMPVLTDRPEWSTLKAVRTNRVYLADGNQYFNRPGPRLVESLEILSELLHPELCAFGHEAVGWELF